MAARAPPRVLFLVCDLQERFRPLIHNFASVLAAARTLVEAAPLVPAELPVQVQRPQETDYLPSDRAVHVPTRVERWRELAGLPTTIMMSTCGDMILTASWRFWVA